MTHLDTNPGANLVRPPARRKQVLALSGGGYRGLYTALFLAACEANFKQSCGNCFDLIAGTSIGAILAAGLACGVPAAGMAKSFRTHGKKIFKRGFATKLKQFVVAGPFDASAVSDAIEEVLGSQADTPLDQISAPLLIAAVNVTHDAPALFRSRGLAQQQASKVTVREAILASAAAPTYFPIRKISGEDYVDGGLVANAPDLVALTQGVTHLGLRLDTTYMLSIGTAGQRQGASLTSKAGNPSAIGWVRSRRLVQMMMAAQEELATTQAATLLGNRYLRIDETPPVALAPAIADFASADDKATQALEILARDSWAKHAASQDLADFFV